MSSMNTYGKGKEKDVEYVRCEEIREVERNDGTATETREMLDIGPENASKLSCMLVEPSSMTKNSVPKPQKKSTFCGEHHLEEEKCSPNLMDQMIAEARDAKASKYKEDQERRNHFGKGLETGFLNTQTGAAYKARRQVKCGNVKNIEVIEAPKSKANSLVLNEVGLTLTTRIPSQAPPIHCIEKQKYSNYFRHAGAGSYETYRNICSRADASKW